LLASAVKNSGLSLSVVDAIFLNWFMDSRPHVPFQWLGGPNAAHPAIES
jgi:hypothetical protein